MHEWGRHIKKREKKEECKYGVGIYSSSSSLLV